MVAFSSKRWLTVRAAYDGSLAAAKGITGSRNLGEASCTGGEAWEAMIWHGIGEGDGVEVAAWCRVSEGVNGAIYRGDISWVCGARILIEENSN
jgi:hypothetical protein